MCLRLASITLLTWFAISCSKNSEKEIIIIENTEEWEFNYASNPLDLIWWDSYQVARSGTEMSVLYYDPDNPDSILLLYINGEKNVQILSVFREDVTFIIPMSSSSEGAIDPVFALLRDEGCFIMYTGYLDDSSREYVVTGCCDLAIEEVQTKSSTRLDPWSRATLDDFADSFEKYFGDGMELWANRATLVAGAGDYALYLGKFLTAFSKIYLYDGVDREKQEEGERSYYEFVINNFLLKIVTSPVRLLPRVGGRVSDMLSIVGDSIFEVYGHKLTLEKANEKATDLDVMSRGLSTRMKQIRIPQKENAIPFNVSVSVGEVGEDRVRVSGKAEYIEGINSVDMTIVDEGFEITGNGSTRRISSSGLADVDISLIPSTLYYVTAYVKTFTGLWKSPAKSFYSKGTAFSYSPSSINFSHDGGTASISINAGDGVNWNVADCPSWCKYTKYSSALAIKAEASTKDRSGLIVMETTNHYGEKNKFGIIVGQEEFTWDNTSWKISATYVWSDLKTVYNLETIIEFGVISQGYQTEGTDSIYGNSYKYQYYVDDNGRAVMVYTEYTSDGRTHQEVYALTRTGPALATVNLSGYEENLGWDSVVTRTVSGEGQATLINQ